MLKQSSSMVQLVQVGQMIKLVVILSLHLAQNLVLVQMVWWPLMGPAVHLLNYPAENHSGKDLSPHRVTISVYFDVAQPVHLSRRFS